MNTVSFRTQEVIGYAICAACFLSFTTNFMYALSLQPGRTFYPILLSSLTSAAACICIMILIYKKKMTSLRTNSELIIEKLLFRIALLEEEIAEINKPVDLSSLTKGEMLVLETFCQYVDTDRGIGERLQLAEGTICQHLYNIRNKLGVDNRLELMELCRNNFL